METWFLIAGGLFLLMALSGSLLRRLPLTTAILYLAVGLGLGPAGIGLIRVDPLRHAELLERLTEVAVLISLFTAGLKLRIPLSDDRWRLPLRLAFLSMALTVGLTAAVGVLALGLPLGAAVLLGAILAPTDPVLASDVQVAHPFDRDRVRFSLTGEAGLNDGTAFPFVLLGLGLLGQHELGALGWRWLVVDVLWAVSAGLGSGLALGTLIGRLALVLRRQRREAVGLDDFLGLGLIALSYGVALMLSAYGFLAVFAAGLALRRIERRSRGVLASEPASSGPVEGAAMPCDPEQAPAYMAQTLLGFNEHLERVAELGMVVLLGGMLSAGHLTWEALWLAPTLFVVIRPLSVALGLVSASATPHERRLVAWFGIRGIGSLYYLLYALQHGLSGALADQLTGLTLTLVAASIVVHGVSMTPLMRLHARAWVAASTR